MKHSGQVVRLYFSILGDLFGVSLAIVDGFKIKKEVLDAFSKIKKIEKMAVDVDRQYLQYDSLIATANHE